MGRKGPIRTDPPKSLVPWWILHSDIVPAGAPCLSRDLVINGRPEKHVAFHVSGQYIPSLGLMAIRYGRRGGQLTPLGIALPDDAPLPIDDTDTGEG